MKTRLKAVLIIISICFGTIVMAQEKKVIYTCPMHPEVQMDKPGTCPKCGMILEKKTVTVKKAKSQPPKQQSQPSSQPGKKTPMDMPVKDTSEPMHHDPMQMKMGTDTIKPK